MQVKEEQEEFEGGEIEFESVDAIVISQLDTIESDTVNKNKLIEIYNGINV